MSNNSLIYQVSQYDTPTINLINEKLPVAIQIEPLYDIYPLSLTVENSNSTNNIVNRVNGQIYNFIYTPPSIRPTNQQRQANIIQVYINIVCIVVTIFICILIYFYIHG